MSQQICAHFAHANGFPSGSYRKLFSHLSDEIHVIALEKFAHNPRFPLNNNWENQVKELIDYVEQNSSEQVIAIGHSFGAVISYLAVCQRPELFKGLIMLDPPLITGLAKYVFRFSKSTKFINKITPAGITALRCREWPVEEDLVAYFASRKLFRNMDKDCIHDYVHAVIKPNGSVKRLDFDPNIEANIFRTIPDNLHQYYGQLKVPATLITGRFTDVCVGTLRRPFLRGNPSIEHRQLNAGGHMFPLEHPIQTAEMINSIIDQWQVDKLS